MYMMALVAMLTSVVAVCVYDFGSHVDLCGRKVFM